MSVKQSDKVTINGKEKTFKQWCLIYLIIPSVAQSRVNKQGMDIIEAITKPVNRHQSQVNNSHKSHWRKQGKSWLRSSYE